MDINPNDTVVVARTRDPIEAQIWVDILRDDGMQAAVFEQGARGALGGASLYGSIQNIVVRRTQFERAREIIADADGTHALIPLQEASESRDRMIRALLTVGGVAIGFLLLFTLVQVVADP